MAHIPRSAAVPLWHLLAATVGAVIPYATPMVVAQTDPWYADSIPLDLTNDGQLETLLLTAHGARSDSLTLVFRILQNDRSLYALEWSVEHYFGGWFDSGLWREEMDTLPASRRDSLVLTELRAFFRAAETGDFPPQTPEFWLESAPRFIATELSLAPEDPEVSAIWTDMLANTKQTFTFYGGYESTLTLAWSARARRFFVVWACC